MLQRERIEGASLSVGELTITPEAELIWLDLPFWRGLWHRPTALLVENAGETSRVPVVDVTRQGQIMLMGVTGLISLVSWIVVGLLRRNR